MNVLFHTSLHNHWLIWVVLEKWTQEWLWLCTSIERPHTHASWVHWYQQTYQRFTLQWEICIIAMSQMQTPPETLWRNIRHVDRTKTLKKNNHRLNIRNKNDRNNIKTHKCRQSLGGRLLTLSEQMWGKVWRSVKTCETNKFASKKINHNKTQQHHYKIINT